jgi:1-acyl-sn-glycerol-3-phosphate acyltransferase
MKIFKYIFILFWRIWFYMWIIVLTALLFPALLVVTSREVHYTSFYKVARLWAKAILFVMGFNIELKAEKAIRKGDSYVLCPNHTSIIDIMVLLSVSKYPFVFVGKKELAKIPLLGFFYKRTCILVDRNDVQSRNAVFEEVRRRLEKGLSVCIFPEGLVSEDESIVLNEFKNGAFRLAIEYQIPIVPMTFYDCKKRFSYTFFSGSPGTLRVKIHDFIESKGLGIQDKGRLKKQTFDLIHNELLQDTGK